MVTRKVRWQTVDNLSEIVQNHRHGCRELRHEWRGLVESRDQNVRAPASMPPGSAVLTPCDSEHYLDLGRRRPVGR